MLSDYCVLQMLPGREIDWSRVRARTHIHEYEYEFECTGAEKHEILYIFLAGDEFASKPGLLFVNVNTTPVRVYPFTGFWQPGPANPDTYMCVSALTVSISNPTASNVAVKLCQQCLQTASVSGSLRPRV